MENTTMPLNPEDVLAEIWRKVDALEVRLQEQARADYRVRLELDSLLGILGMITALRLRVIELEEKVKGLGHNQPSHLNP